MNDHYYRWTPRTRAEHAQYWEEQHEASLEEGNSTGLGNWERERAQKRFKESCLSAFICSQVFLKIVDGVKIILTFRLYSITCFLLYSSGKYVSTILTVLNESPFLNRRTNSKTPFIHKHLTTSGELQLFSKQIIDPTPTGQTYENWKEKWCVAGHIQTYAWNYRYETSLMEIKVMCQKQLDIYIFHSQEPSWPWVCQSL